MSLKIIFLLIFIIILVVNLYICERKFFDTIENYENHLAVYGQN